MSDYWQLLKRYLLPQRGAVLLMAILLLASIVLQLMGPQVARSFIDAARAGAAEELLIQSALLFIAISVVQQVMVVLATYWSERVAWSATNALRADLTDHLVRLDLGFHKVHSPGELVERVDGDVNILAGLFSSFVVQLLGSGLLLIGVVVAVFLVDLRLGLAFAVFTTGAIVFLSWIRQFGAPYWKAERERSAAHYGYIGEALAAAEDIRSSGALPYAMRRFFEHLRGWLPVTMRAELWSSAIWMAAAGVFAFGDALTFGLGGNLYFNGAISLGAMYMVFAYTAMLAAPIETIRTQLQDLQRADAGVARVRELFAFKSALADGQAALPEGALAVEFEDVSYAYAIEEPSASSSITSHVLQDISFSIKPGQILGLLGRTGSGKTTLARLLFRMFDPQQGTIWLGGIDLRCASLASVRARVGLVTQDVQLFEASLRDNVTFFNAQIADEQLLEVFTALGLKEWLARLPEGLDTPISGARLSAGEAQLIALARVFIKDPGLVILDEASSRLDPATEALLEQALGRLLKGRTVLIIAHRLQTVERADDILILDRGRILEYGRREQLARDSYSHFAALRRSGLGEVLV